MKKLTFSILFIFSSLCCISSYTYAASSKEAIIAAFGAEGGKNCRKDDPGNKRPDGTFGCTDFGISPKSYGYNIPDTLDGAAKIYEHDFWNPLHLGEIHNQIVANAIFLAAINQGLPTWERKFQEAINLSNDFSKDIIVDGHIGSKTIEAANKCDQIELYVNIIILQGSRYQDVVLKHPNMRSWYRDLMYRMRNGVRTAVHQYDAALAKKEKQGKGLHSP